MPQKYEPEFKRKIVRLHLNDGRTIKSLIEEYGISKAAVSKWCEEYSKECQAEAVLNPDSVNDLEIMKENLRLKKKIEEQEKEILFLKKAAAFFAYENNTAAHKCFPNILGQDFSCDEINTKIH